ncbi:MAG TPA: PhnD/SsuA/transferrin family substrate-binding protein [Kofleriaceae bacterium]|jgi:phosphonate transport system substrate-binding protein|nr:PhnD/SsuA/transferrin family substrate-binding protein [Kofleriaceae bacterium]
MPITVAVVPSATPGDSRAALAAVCDALGAILRERVTAFHPDSYMQLVDALQKDRVQYAWMSPALVVLAGEHIQLRPLLSPVRGDLTTYRGVLFVDARSALHTIDDLRGKRVAWVDQTSAAGYLYPRLELAARGIDVAVLFSEELYARSHADVVRAVLDGRADVGATYAIRPPDGQPIRRAAFVDVAPERPVRIIEWTAEIPNDAICGHGLLSKQEHRVFGNAILTLCEQEHGRRLLFEAFHAERFVATPRNAFKPLWRLVEEARMHGLLTHL